MFLSNPTLVLSIALSLTGSPNGYEPKLHSLEASHIFEQWIYFLPDNKIYFIFCVLPPVDLSTCFYLVVGGNTVYDVSYTATTDTKPMCFIQAFIFVHFNGKHLELGF